MVKIKPDPHHYILPSPTRYAEYKEPPLSLSLTHSLSLFRMVPQQSSPRQGYPVSAILYEESPHTAGTSDPTPLEGAEVAVTVPGQQLRHHGLPAVDEPDGQLVLDHDPAGKPQMQQTYQHTNKPTNQQKQRAKETASGTCDR